MVDMFAHNKNIVYTLYIQTAENRQKNESLSKNKNVFLGEDLLVKRK